MRLALIKLNYLFPKKFIKFIILTYDFNIEYMKR